MTEPESPQPFSVAILAGGFGTRLGQEKAGALAAGRPLLEWTAEALAGLSDDLLVVRRVDQTLPPAPAGVTWREITDRRAQAGPLAGIEAALQAIRHDVVVTVACDMPLIRPTLVRALAAACADVDVVMPYLDGRDQPLLAAYRRTCLATIDAQLAAGDGRIRAIVPKLRSRRLERPQLEAFDPDLISFTNINYPADLERVATELTRRATAGERAEDAP